MAMSVDRRYSFSGEDRQGFRTKNARLYAAAGLTIVVGCSGDPRESTGESREEVRVCPGATTVEGVDVSYYQGKIDWNQVKASGVKFAVTRISDGLNFKDSQFDTNWAAIQSEGLLRGAYQYFEPAQDAAAQANMVVQKVGLLG